MNIISIYTLDKPQNDLNFKDAKIDWCFQWFFTLSLKGSQWQKTKL